MFPIALVTAPLQVTLGCKVVLCTSPAAVLLSDPACSLLIGELEESIAFTYMMFSGFTVYADWTAFR